MGSRGTITHLDANEVRQRIADHQERDYLLIDVRQPQEYQSGHIPGARLLPLPELEQRTEELRAQSGKELVFYCRSGARSMRAATYAASALHLPRVHNLVGGISAYQGEVLPDLPRLRATQLGGTAKDVLERALEMEKGTYDLYTRLRACFPAGEVGADLEELARAEVAHARSLYRTLQQLGNAPAEDFAAHFERRTGSLVESGAPLAEVVEQAQQAGQQGTLHLLELALELELRAHDMYKSLASESDMETSRDTLLDLAQQEKRHAQAIATKLGRMANPAR